MRLSFTKILKFQKPKNKRGFTLLEMMVSLFLITVGVMGIFLVINRTLILMTPSPSKVIAAYLTQEGIEIVRNIRDGNWIEQQKTNPTPPISWNRGLPPIPPSADNNYQADYDDLGLTNYNSGGALQFDGAFYNYGSGTYTKFDRRINIVQLDSNSLKVTVEVKWPEKGKNYTYTAQEILYNWYTPPAP